MFQSLRTCSIVASVAVSSLSPQSPWSTDHPAPPGGQDVRMCWHGAFGRIVAVAARNDAATMETWEWDGARWLQRRTAQAPRVRQGYSLACDAARRVVVLFGGHEPVGPSLGDTWEWDGVAWTQRATASAPSPRASAGMAYDVGRARVVLYGGNDGNTVHQDLWEWDGTRWTQRPQSSPSPGARTGSLLAHDAARGRTVLFGGNGDNATIHDDVWEYDGMRWFQPLAATRPPRLRAASLTYDPSVQRSVLYGGFSASGPNTDVWEWDGVRWQTFAATPSPGECLHPGFTFDVHGAHLLLHGGKPDAETWKLDRAAARWTSVGPVIPKSIRSAHVATDWSGHTLWVGRAETLTFDHATHRWRREPSAAHPSASLIGGMTFDPVRREAVLFGSVNGGGPETWNWSEATRDWRRLNPAVEPPATQYGMLAFDLGRGRAVLFGGLVNGVASGDTWEWDGVTWTRKNPITSPPPRIAAVLAYDLFSSRIVLFGGASATRAFDDVWEWNGVDWARRTMLNTGPGPRAGAAHGSRADGVLIVAGDDARGSWFDDVWLLRRDTWQQVTPPGSGLPPLTPVHGAFDIVHDEFAVFGGNASLRGRQLLTTNGLWIHGVPRAAEVRYGVGCAGTAGNPQLVGRGLPVIGNAGYALEARQLVPAQPVAFLIGTSTTMFELSFACRIFVAPIVAAGAAVMASGTSVLPLPVPPFPQLAGVELHAQAAALDRAGPGVVVTPALRLRIGR